MKTITVIFDEPLHHVCLMYGLKQTFGKMPFMNRRIIRIGGRTMIMEKPVASPPMMRNPQRASSRIRTSQNIVDVSYWRERLAVEYDEGICSIEDITTFVANLVEDYLQHRHPFMKISVENGIIKESSSGHQIAEIIGRD